MSNDLISRSALLKEMRVSGRAAYMVVEDAPAVDAEEVFKSLPYVKEALEMAKQTVVPVVRCADCRYLKTCNRTIELIPRQAQIGYLRCVVHSCEYGERRSDDATD